MPSLNTKSQHEKFGSTTIKRKKCKNLPRIIYYRLTQEVD